MNMRLVTTVVTAGLLSATLWVPDACAQGGQPGLTAPSKWADTIAAAIDHASLAGDLKALQDARAMAERVAMAYPQDGLILHYEGYALYCEGTVLVVRKQDGWSQLQRAVSVLQQSLKTRPLPETHALIATIDGQLIGNDPSRAMELGMASQQAMSEALSLGAKNPRVWLLRGMSTLFTPPEYGGGAKPAEEQLLKAAELFKTDKPKAGEPSWGGAEVHLWLGQTYAQLGDTTKAAAEYKAALDMAPNFAYVRALAAALKP